MTTLTTACAVDNSTGGESVVSIYAIEATLTPRLVRSVGIHALFDLTLGEQGDGEWHTGSYFLPGPDKTLIVAVRKLFGGLNPVNRAVLVDNVTGASTVQYLPGSMPIRQFLAVGTATDGYLYLLFADSEEDYSNQHLAIYRALPGDDFAPQISVDLSSLPHSLNLPGLIEGPSGGMAQVLFDVTDGALRVVAAGEYVDEFTPINMLASIDLSSGSVTFGAPNALFDRIAENEGRFYRGPSFIEAEAIGSEVQDIDGAMLTSLVADYGVGRYAPLGNGAGFFRGPGVIF
jgi:hypothetical protein